MLTLAYELASCGCPGCGAMAVAADDRTVVIRHVFGGLGRLAVGVAVLLEGARSSTCEWVDEPVSDQHWWRLTRDGAALRVRIEAHPHRARSSSADGGDVRFETECDVLRFARQLASQLQRLIDARRGEATLADDAARLRAAIRSFRTQPRP